MSIEAIVNEFSAVAANPKGQLKAYKDAGKKCIGVMPYYAPEELVYAAGMMPFGMWGSNNKTEQRSKEYCATFYCTIAQLALEMLLDGTMDKLDGIITPTICDTLRPMSQNIRVAMSEKLPCIFLAHPQNRFADWGKQFCLDQYNNVKAGLEKIAGHEIKSEDIAAAIKVYNKSRAARREFVKLASDHCDVIDPIMRSAVLKAAWFMDKAEYTEKLNALNAELKALPAAKWNGVKVVTSGIICDNPKLLQIIDDNHMAIVADDVAHESRSFRTDVPEMDDPMMALEMNVGIVRDVHAAIDHINRHGSHHSDCIVTNDAARARAFLRLVDSAAVYHNASTRFTDGAEFGMGAEIGISTDKLHARGPMGLEELTTYKYVVTGDGTVRK